MLTAVLALSALCTCLPAPAQTATPPWRIAVVTGDRPGAVEAFVAGLRDLNYVEGRDFVIEARRYTSHAEQLHGIAAELAQIKPDVIVVGGALPAKAITAANKATPIVMAVSSDAIAQGVIATLARPGGNVTGFTNMTRDLTTKRVELLKEAAPQASRIAVLGCGLDPGNVQPVGQQAGVTLVPAIIREADELRSAFANAMRQRIDAVLVLECGIFPHAAVVTGLVNESRLPAMYPTPRYAEAGGLMAYGPDTIDQFRRSAGFVDKILRGAKRADIPVEQPTKLHLVINRKAAKSTGLSLPQTLLVRADRVID
jgi:putative ABC transport system substrate-binding protein